MALGLVANDANFSRLPSLKFCGTKKDSVVATYQSSPSCFSVVLFWSFDPKWWSHRPDPSHPAVTAFTYLHAFWECRFCVLGVYSAQLPWLYGTALPAYNDFLDPVIEEVLFIQKLLFSVTWSLSHREMGKIVFCLASPPAFPSCLQCTSLTISLMKSPLDHHCQLLKSENGAGLKLVSGNVFGV